jgi:hypothetical protein
MSFRNVSAAPEQTRDERIEAIMSQMRPKIDEVVNKLVERAVDVPEKEEFGAIDLEFRDAGLRLANDVRQASVASRKKGGRRFERALSPMQLRRQVPLLPATQPRDRPQQGQAAQSLLLLRPIQAELPALRSGVGFG